MTSKWIAGTAAILLAATGLGSPASALISDARAERDAAGTITLRWTAPAKVDVFQTDKADGDIASARLISRNDSDGTAAAQATAGSRPYFLLKDRSDGSVTRVAERLVPLQQGSNFRDIGGYPGADGRHVRWGLIYRSGATAMLTPEDVATVGNLGLREMIDLRSSEERVLAPSRIDGVTYTAHAYAMQRIFAAMKSTGGVPQNGGTLYRGLPTMLAPQMKLLFAALLSRQGPVEYNCSAGQDRTGFATALILSALGTPRDVILKDYLLSTGYRQPQWEMPPIDPAHYPDNPIARMFAMARTQKAQPLKEADGTPFLVSAFQEIDAKWGSTEGYLQQVVGLTPVDIAALRAGYLE